MTNDPLDQATLKAVARAKAYLALWVNDDDDVDQSYPGAFRGSDLRTILDALDRKEVEPARKADRLERTFDEGDVERVAVAMANAAWASVGEGWNDASDEQQNEFRIMARAALAALQGDKP